MKKRVANTFRIKLSLCLLTTLLITCLVTLAIPLLINFNLSNIVFENVSNIFPPNSSDHHANPVPDLVPDPTPDPMIDPSFLKEIQKNYLIPPRTSGGYKLTNPKPGLEYSEHPGTIRKILDYLGSNKPGFFVEVGAFDGERLSNTLNLEKDYKWTGLLMEPNRFIFEKLKKKGRNAWLANICLSDTSGAKNMTFEFSKENPIVSRKLGMKNVINPREDVYWLTMPKTIANVTCLPIFSMLAALNVYTVDFFSLDVEGFELPVLKTIPFDRVLIKVFLIEQNNWFDKSISVFMKKKGYIEKPFLKTSRVDHLFVHPSVKVRSESAKFY